MIYENGINPYRLGVISLLRRLRWDLRRESRVSRQHLREVKDSQKGKSALILCNGPSLNRVDFEAVERSGVFVIGLNKINLLYDRTTLRPHSIVCVNPHVIEQNADYFNSTEIPLYLAKQAVHPRPIVPQRENVTYLYQYEEMRGPVGDVTNVVVTGATVTTVALQLAIHMGFSKIGLVGCDHNFASKGEAHKAVKAGDKDPDHFHPEYFSKGVTWQLPDLVESELFYGRTRTLAERLDRRILNCTEGGKLEVFERCSLHEFLKS